MIRSRTMLLILLLAIVACAGVLAMTSEQNPTLLVLNDSGAHVKVYADSRLLGVVTGKQQCIILRSLGQSQNVLSFVQIAHDPVAAPAIMFSSFEGWQIRLANSWKFDVLSLQPAKRCER